MKVRQCPSCGGFCKKSGCERRDNIVPCKHFLAGTTNKSKEDCPYCRIESLEATCPAWHDAPTVPGLWVCRQAITDNVQAYEVTDQMALNRNLKLKGQWYGPIPEDKQS